MRPRRTRHLYRRLLREARPFGMHITGLMGLGALSSVFALLTPLPLKLVVDSVIGSKHLPAPLDALPHAISGSDTGILVFAAILFVTITLLRQLEQFASLVLSTYAGQKLLLNFRARLFRHVQRLSFAYHDTRGITDST